MTSGPAEAAAAVAGPFRCAGYRGELSEAFTVADLEREVLRLVDPASARDTVHWGRNYLYGTTVTTDRGPVEVVVKQFRNQGARARLRRRLQGSKAERSWRIARHLAAAGFPTPEPVLLIEAEEPEGPSFFVSRRVTGSFEARYFLRALEAGRVAEEFPGLDPAVVLEALGRMLRRLHDLGVWHRDISVGNLLVRPCGDGRAPELFLVDLNRARVVDRLSLHQRTRDLCRLRIFERRHQDLFLEAYWRDRGNDPRRRILYRLYNVAFRRRVDLKDWVKSLLPRLGPRRAHVHIPAAEARTAARDRVVWDRLSDQPHQHASRLRRFGLRLADAGDHLRELGAATRAAPAVVRRFRELRRELFREPVEWGGAGVAVRPLDGGPRPVVEALRELGLRHVFLRLDTWEEDRDAEEELARTLADEGYELSFGIAQNRELVRDPGRWREAVEDIGRRFTPYGRRFQIGQAVNRSKWGIWTSREYARLFETASAVLRRYQDVELLGPAVIDFELHVTAALVNLPFAARFDVVSSLLYVDRRGAPENRQLGFDTLGKVVLLKAIADTARNAAGRCWITEMNWPLREGPHAPAGRSVAVDEQTQADYLVRYYLLTLASGLVERVFWWRLAARGYGLAVREPDGVLRRRPAFAALRTLEAELRGAVCSGALAAPGDGRLLDFRRPDGSRLVVGWSAGPPVEAELPSPVESRIGRDGERLDDGSGRRVELGQSPSYFRLPG